MSPSDASTAAAPASASAAPAAQPADIAAGLATALAAFLIWGFAPLYFKAIDRVGAAEIMAHRVVWTLLMLTVIVVALGRRREVLAALATRRRFAILAVTTGLVTVNWFTFIWAILNDRLLEASLGYYINPLVNVVLGVAFLAERLSPRQGVSVLLAVVGVGVLIAGFGTVPWVALLLALTFGFYALVRKKARIDPLVGLLVETLLVAPVALAYLAWIAAAGGGSFGVQGWGISLALIAAGVVSGAPLVLYMYGAQRLTLSTIGLMQYLAPTIHFGLALWVFGEAFTITHLATFGFIWAGLALYSWDAMAHYRRLAAAAEGRRPKPP